VKRSEGGEEDKKKEKNKNYFPFPLYPSLLSNANKKEPVL